MSETCPKCGARLNHIDHTRGGLVFECRTLDGRKSAAVGKVVVSAKCLRNQLAAMTAERDALAAKLARAVAMCCCEWNGQSLAERLEKETP